MRAVHRVRAPPIATHARVVEGAVRHFLQIENFTSSFEGGTVSLALPQLDPGFSRMREPGFTVCVVDVRCPSDVFSVLAPSSTQ